MAKKLSVIQKTGPAPGKGRHSQSGGWEGLQEAQDFRVTRAGPTVKITLTRSHKGNTLTPSMLQGLTQIYRDLAKDQTVFHIVLTAEGRFFCTGMDLSGGTKTTEKAYRTMTSALFATIDNSPQTTIALISGPCYGGAVGLGFVCDVRLASPKSRWTLSEVKIGVSPAIISRYLAREWWFSFLREAMLSGREVHCTELQRIRAIHRVSEDLDNLLDE